MEGLVLHPVVAGMVLQPTITMAVVEPLHVAIAPGVRAIVVVHLRRVMNITAEVVGMTLLPQGVLVDRLLKTTRHAEATVRIHMELPHLVVTKIRTLVDMIARHAKGLHPGVMEDTKSALGLIGIFLLMLLTSWSLDRLRV